MLPLIKDIKLGAGMHQEFKSEGKSTPSKDEVNPLEGVSVARQIRVETLGILLGEIQPPVNVTEYRVARNIIFTVKAECCKDEDDA